MVYLTLLGIGQDIPIGKNDAIADLVEKALYNTYDDDIRRFLLRLSAMDSFTAEQAAFVTEEPRTEEFLKKLRLENAFIAYDRAEGVYRIHSVLLDFLRAMQKNKQEKKVLYRRFGEWYLAKGAHVPACSCLCRAGDTARILSLLNDVDNIAYNSTYFEGFLEMFTAIPHETLFKYPFAYLQYISIMICGNFALIRLFIYLGKTSDALELMRKLSDDVARENNIYYNTALELVEGYVYACLGLPDSIPLRLQTGDMSLAHFMFEGIAFNYIIHGKAVLFSKDYVRLEILTEEFTRYFSVFHNQLGFLHNKILEAAAKYRLYGMKKGCEALKEGIGMAREDHLILPFAEYAPAILDMLQDISHSDSRDAYIKEVLTACQQYSESIKNTPQSAASLSLREIEILALASEGLKRDEIAGRLHVSTATVRTHLQNIYRKLEVGGRTAAIKKAETLKLL